MSGTEATLNTSKKPKKLVNVVLLTGHEHQTYVDVKAKFQDVFNQVAAHYGLREVEYFGLAEQKDGEYHFVSLEDKVHKHAPKSWKSSSGEGLDKHGRPILTVHFRVQYFVDQVVLLREKITRQLYYLQLKENVLQYRYLYSEERCFQLAAFSLQTDLGNFSPSRYSEEQYFDPREYFPAWVVDKRGPDYLMKNVPVMHQDLRQMTKSDAQLKFIREASLSPAAHNLHFYRLKKRKTDKVWNAWLGIFPKGVEIYEDSADGFKDLISTFFWPDIGKLYFEKKKFEIRSVGSWDGRKFTYYTDSDAKSKFLLGLCRSTHMFQMAIQPKLNEIRHLDAEDKRYRESYIYSDARDMAANRAVSPARSLLSGKKATGTGQRYSVVSNTSSNTTSGIVSDKLHISFDESEEFEEDRMSEIMIDSPPRPSLTDYSPRPAMGTAMLTTPKQGRGRLVPFSPKTHTGMDRRGKEISKSPVTRTSSNGSQGSKGSGHVEMSPITSNGSYRSRLQQHQQMLQGARLQQLASQQPPFSGQGLQSNSPQSAAKGQPPSPSASAKAQPFSLPPKPPQVNTSSTAQSSGQTQGFSLPPKTASTAQSPAQGRTRTQESPQRPNLNQGTPKVQVKAGAPLQPAAGVSAATKPPLPPPAQSQVDKTCEEVSGVVPQLSVPLSLPTPLTVPLSITPSAQQPYTAQQVQVKQPQQFLAQQVSPGQPKLPQQYYSPADPHPKPTPAVSQFTVQQHSTPLQQFAQEQPISQQQFAVPLSQAQPKFSAQKKPQVSQPGYVVQPQPHRQFLVPVPPGQFSVVHSQSQKQYAVQPTPPLYPAIQPPATQQAFPLNPAPIYNLAQQTVMAYPPQGNLPQYPVAPLQYGLADKPGKSSRPASRTPSRGDSFKKTLGQLQVHQKSSSAPCDPPSRPLTVNLDPPVVAPIPDLLPVTLDQPEEAPAPTYTPVVNHEELVSVDENVAVAEIDAAYASLFDAYGEDYLVSDTDEQDSASLELQDTSLSSALGQPAGMYPQPSSSVNNPSIPFSYEELEQALDQALQAAAEPNELAEQDMDEEAIRARRTRIAVKNKKEKLHPELEEIRGNVKQFSLPLITALFNDSTIVPSTSGHSSDQMYDTSTICSNDSRWSYDTDSRRLSSSYPSSTGTMISLYSASRPFSWHSEHLGLDSQWAASMRMSSRMPALLDNHRSEPRSLNEVPVFSNPPVASWTQAIAYGNHYGLSSSPSVDRYSPELLASQHMIPPKISSGGHTKPESNIKTLKENVGIA